jgi:S1-C subfamily serine protease
MYSSGEGFALSIDSTAEFSIKSALQPGASGSPVLDQDGVVVGMVRAKPQNSQTIAYVISSGPMRLLLRGQKLDN